MIKASDCGLCSGCLGGPVRVEKQTGPKHKTVFPSKRQERIREEKNKTGDQKTELKMEGVRGEVTSPSGRCYGCEGSRRPSLVTKCSLRLNEFFCQERKLVANSETIVATILQGNGEPDHVPGPTYTQQVSKGR